MKGRERGEVVVRRPLLRICGGRADTDYVQEKGSSLIREGREIFSEEESLLASQ